MRDRPHILVVDDDREIVQALEIRLKAAGLDVVVSHDGNRAIDVAKNEQPDLIVLDVRMPVMDGLTALTQLKEHQATNSIPVVMVSASLSDKRRAIDLGACAFLAKPFDPKTLTAVVAKHLKANEFLGESRVEAKLA